MTASLAAGVRAPFFLDRFGAGCQAGPCAKRGPSFKSRACWARARAPPSAAAWTSWVQIRGGLAPQAGELPSSWPPSACRPAGTTRQLFSPGQRGPQPGKAGPSYKPIASGIEALEARPGKRRSNWSAPSWSCAMWLSGPGRRGRAWTAADPRWPGTAARDACMNLSASQKSTRWRPAACLASMPGCAKNGQGLLEFLMEDEDGLKAQAGVEAEGLVARAPWL